MSERTPDASRRSMAGASPSRGRPVRAGIVSLLAGLAVGTLAGCGGASGGDPGAAGDPAAGGEGPGITAGAVLDVHVSGIGTNRASSDAVWVDAGRAATGEKAISSPATIAGGLDLTPLSTQAVDIAGFRYVTAVFGVRNAQSCATPGTCAPYGTPLVNGGFMAAATAGTIDGTALLSMTRADGSAASPALAVQFLPMHAPDATGAADPLRASLQVYRESETPAFAAPITTVFPYGFVIRNVGNGSRTLPANPPAGQFAGSVAFSFRVPLQVNPADNPTAFTVRLVSTRDTNTRVTQSMQERSPGGDNAANARAASLGSRDLVVLGSARLARTHAGNPICSVRTAGTVVNPTAFLVNEPPTANQLIAAPLNQENVPRNSDVSLGFCQTMTPPTATRLFVHGSMSGRRVTGTAYGGQPDGGLATSRPNQLVWSIAGQRSFHLNETVTVTATSANTTHSGNVPIATFVASYRVRGATGPSSGSLSAASPLAMGAGPRYAVLGDVNRDGLLDIVAVTFAQDIRVRLGSGNGAFAAATSFAPGTARASLVLGDVNGDGLLDIVTANDASNTVSVLLNTGAGGFGAPSSFAVGTQPRSVAVGDLNGDGRLDIVVANSLSDSVSVLLGTGGGNFGAATSFAMGVAPSSVAVGDINGDGRMDIVAANAGSNTVSIRLGMGNGGFGAVTDVPVGPTPVSVALGDLDGDGRLDMVTANTAGDSVSVLRGTGTLSFTAAIQHAVLAGPETVALGDMNGDGVLDIVTANRNSGSVSVLAGLGWGNFGPMANFLTVHPNSAALGDVNGDGRLDVVAANASFNVSVLAGQ